MSELDGQAEQRKILWVKIGTTSYTLGDERTPGIILVGIGLSSAPVRVVELSWSDGMHDTILPCINDRLHFRHEPVAQPLIEIPKIIF